MTRTVARQLAVQIGFSIANDSARAQEALDTFFDEEYYASLAEENELYSEYPNKKQQHYIRAVVTGTAEHARQLDAFVEKYARGWKVSRISRIALTILRTALFEILYMEDVPNSAAINEAVELAKSYEEPETVSFINGILGSFMRGELGAEPRPEPVGTASEEPAETIEEPVETSEEPKPDETKLEEAAAVDAAEKS